jgi:hypothetical protein
VSGFHGEDLFAWSFVVRGEKMAGESVCVRSRKNRIFEQIRAGAPKTSKLRKIATSRSCMMMRSK